MGPKVWVIEETDLHLSWRRTRRLWLAMRCDLYLTVFMLMQVNQENWHRFENFRVFQKFAINLKSVNDPAERNIRLIQDLFHQVLRREDRIISEVLKIIGLKLTKLWERKLLFIIIFSNLQVTYKVFQNYKVYPIGSNKL